MNHRRIVQVALTGLGVLTSFACTGATDDTGPGGTTSSATGGETATASGGAPQGGITATGGSTATVTGGTSAATGGMPTGGISPTETGGSTTAPTGGVGPAQTGGSSATPTGGVGPAETGGSTATPTGGRGPGRGGTSATGGASGRGGTSAGGRSGATGGTSSSGGESGASGGAATGGSSGTPPSGDPDPSEGCGSAAPSACQPCTLNGLEYYVDMPDSYDPNHPYPVVFQYHPLGGTASGARTMYRVRPIFGNAIYVSPEGSDNGFPNQGGVDEKMTRDIMADIEARLCVDRARYFATGFSYGGSMSYTAACNMSDKFRAVAAMAGAPISGATCTRQTPERPVAVLGIHGEEDTALAITMAEPIIGTWIEKNGCTEQTQPSDLLDSICATVESSLPTGEYQGCMEGYPVIWCPMPGRPHEIPSWSPNAIASFFMQF